MWALSLALYVKSGRTPWVVNGIQPDTAFAGIGYSVMNGPSGSNVVVGCSHIYSSDGRGMKYKLSKIQNYSFCLSNCYTNCLLHDVGMILTVSAEKMRLFVQKSMTWSGTPGQK